MVVVMIRQYFVGGLNVAYYGRENWAGLSFVVGWVTDIDFLDYQFYWEKGSDVVIYVGVYRSPKVLRQMSQYSF